MPIWNFGVWKGKLVSLSPGPSHLDTHSYILLDNVGKPKIIEAAINTRSGSAPESGLVF